MKNLLIHTTLSNGTRILIRRLKPNDKENILSAFNKLSPRTRYLRYSSAGVKLTKGDLDKMTRQDDNYCQTMGAFDLDNPNMPLIGFSEFLKCDEKEGAAEFAIVIADDYQKRGLGALLLDMVIILVQRTGFEYLSAHVMQDNTGMIRLLKKFNPEINYLGQSMIRFDMSLISENSLKNAVGLSCHYNEMERQINYELRPRMTAS